MRRISGLDALELVIMAIFFGVIALAAIGAYSLAYYIFPGESQSMIRWGAVVLGLALGMYLAGWVVFKDLGPTYTKMILKPFLAPKIQVIVPKGFSGFVTVMFGDALGVMEKDKKSGFFVVHVGSDGKAIVPCPPRLVFFWDAMLGIRASDDSVIGLAAPRMFYPWHWGFGRGKASYMGLTAYYITFYFDTPEHLEDIKAGKRDAPERSYREEMAMVDDYYGRFGVKRP